MDTGRGAAVAADCVINKTIAMMQALSIAGFYVRAVPHRGTEMTTDQLQGNRTCQLKHRWRVNVVVGGAPRG